MKLIKQGLCSDIGLQQLYNKRCKVHTNTPKLRGFFIPLLIHPHSTMKSGAGGDKVKKYGTIKLAAGSISSPKDYIILAIINQPHPPTACTRQGRQWSHICTGRTSTLQPLFLTTKVTTDPIITDTQPINVGFTLQKRITL